MNARMKMMYLLVALVAVVMVSGCQNWEKKYSGLNVEHQNLQGLYENCVTTLESSNIEKSQIGQELVTTQQTIEELQKLIQERNISPGEATGFGEGYDVAVDSRAGTITVTLPNAILFAAGKASLKKASIAELNHVLGVINERYHDREINIVGHTDSDPIKKSKWKDNWQLSSERSLSVLRYLEKKGIIDERLMASAAGASRPIGPNSSESGKARNRRVEIVVNMR